MDAAVLLSLDPQLVQSLGQQWVAGAPITELAQQAGVTWHSLVMMLQHAGFHKSKPYHADKAKAKKAPPPAAPPSPSPSPAPPAPQAPAAGGALASSLPAAAQPLVQSIVSKLAKGTATEADTKAFHEQVSALGEPIKQQVYQALGITKAKDLWKVANQQVPPPAPLKALLAPPPAGPTGATPAPAPPALATAGAAAPAGPLSAAEAKALLAQVSSSAGLTAEEVRQALQAHAHPGNPTATKHRARIESAILQSGLALPDAARRLLAHHHDPAKASAFAAAIANGDTAKAAQEYAHTPLYDLQCLSKITVLSTPVQGQAVCHMGTRSVTMGSTSATGDYRHELGHAVHAAIMGGWGGTTPLSEAVEQHYAQVMQRVKADPAGLKAKMTHEWYEEHYGVIGRRGLDNSKEDFAEHYRGYHKALYRDRQEGTTTHLGAYRQRHPEMAALFDARYTAALLAAVAGQEQSA